MQKTFRLFVSSTFSDFTEERKLLHKKVFPKIKEKCKENNLTFQPIDLRWGVTDEASNDQKTLELCLEEVQSSKLTPYPNFLIMAGDRYGTVILPYAIEQEEFETLVKLVDTTKNKKLLNTWYILDENQIPASYILESRKGDSEKNKSHDGVDYTIRANWKPINKSLLDILQNAAKNSSLSEAKKKKYFQSATEAEVIEGIFKYLDKTPKQIELLKKDPQAENVDYENVYAYIRNIDSVDNEELKIKFIDEDTINVEEFKKEIRKSINKNNIYEENHKVNLTNVAVNENGSLEYYYKELSDTQNNFVTEMINFLEKSINEYVEELKKHEDEDLEKFEQERFKKSKLKDFLEGSRQTALNRIDEYINSNEDQALVIYGPSGMGKSSLMAKAIANAESKFKDTNTKVMYRFVGSTSNLTNTPEILISILKDLGITEEIRKVRNEQTLQEEPEEIEELYFRINNHLKSLEENVLIFIDAIDQVNNEDNFLWLPLKLPPNVKIIISALDDEVNYPKDTKYFKDLKNKTNNLYKLEEFEKNQAKQFIFNVLEKYNRTIQENQPGQPNSTTNQMEYLLNIYKDIKTPLYLSVAAYELRHWRSYDYTDLDIELNKERSDKEKIEFKSYAKKQSLANTQKGIIEEYINNLTTFFHHDEEFVKRVFSYLYLTEGLSESELLEVLNTDLEFISKIAPDKNHVKENKELPIVIWARLHSQIKELIKLEEKDGQETMSFFHREFNEVISNQIDIKEIHEYLIELNTKLVNFSNLRWNNIYQNLISKYHLHYEFKYELDYDSKIFFFAKSIANDCSFKLMSEIQEKSSIESLDFTVMKYLELSFKEEIDNFRQDLSRLLNTQTKFYFYFLINFIEKNINHFGFKEIEHEELTKIRKYFNNLGLIEQVILVELKISNYLEEEIKISNTYLNYDNCISSYNIISNYYFKLNKLNKSIYYKEKAIEIAKDKYNKELYRGYEVYLKNLSELPLLLKNHDDIKTNKINEFLIKEITQQKISSENKENFLYLHTYDILNNVINFNLIIKNYEISLKLTEFNLSLSKLNKKLNAYLFQDEDDRIYCLFDYFLIYSLKTYLSKSNVSIEEKEKIKVLFQTIFDETATTYGTSDSDDIEKKFREISYVLDRIDFSNITLFENVAFDFMNLLYINLFKIFKNFNCYSVNKVFLIEYLRFIVLVSKKILLYNANDNSLLYDIFKICFKIVLMMYKYYISVNDFLSYDDAFVVEICKVLNFIENNSSKYANKKFKFNTLFIRNKIIKKSINEIFSSMTYQHLLSEKKSYTESFSDYLLVNYLNSLLELEEELNSLNIIQNKNIFNIEPDILRINQFKLKEITLYILEEFFKRYIKNKFESNQFNYQYSIETFFNKSFENIKSYYKNDYYKDKFDMLDYYYKESTDRYIKYLEDIKSDNVKYFLSDLLEVKEIEYEIVDNNKKELLLNMIYLQNKIIQFKNYAPQRQICKIALSYEKDQNYNSAINYFSESLYIAKELYYETPKEYAIDYICILFFIITYYESKNEFKYSLWIELLEVIYGILVNKKTYWKKIISFDLAKNPIDLKQVIYEKFISLLLEELSDKSKCIEFLLLNIPSCYGEKFVIRLQNFLDFKNLDIINQSDLIKKYLKINSSSTQNETLEWSKNISILEKIYLEEKSTKFDLNTIFDEIDHSRAYFKYLNKIAFESFSSDKVQEALKYFIRSNQIFYEFSEENKIICSDDYLNNLDCIGSLEMRIKDFKKSFLSFKQYFLFIDLDDAINCVDDLADLIYPFVKYYQSSIHINEDLVPLEIYAKEKIEYLKNKFGDDYSKEIETMHNGYKTLLDSDDPFDNEKYEIFVKIFYSNN